MHFVACRALRRRWVAHLGPTNSGKTHQALEALRAAPSGLYAGPLRLLACEVFDRQASSAVSLTLLGVRRGGAGQKEE